MQQPFYFHQRSILTVSAIQSRQDAYHAVFAERHIGVLPVNDRVSQVYLHLVGPGRDVQDLRTIVECRCLSGLRAIHEYDGT